MKAQIATVFSFLFFLTTSLHGAGAQQVGEPHELLGFLLRQNSSAFNAALGAPFNTGKRPDGTTYMAYRIPDAKESYLAVVFVKDEAVTLELTGTDYCGPTGFLGLKLGDDASAVQTLLGKPAAISHEDDVNVDLWDYKQKNYSLEFTAAHKLYSIQIVDEIKSKPEGIAGSSDVYEFAQAISSPDIEKLIQLSSGGLECTNTDSFGFRTNSARVEFADHNSQFHSCLTSAAKAILSLGPEMKGVDQQMRLYEKTPIAAVTKFPDTSPLKEVVFVWETGRWRIYEVTFR
jgi:hypothetical protein